MRRARRCVTAVVDLGGEDLGQEDQVGLAFRAAISASREASAERGQTQLGGGGADRGTGASSLRARLVAGSRRG
jgi:hypothetical protein